MTQILRVSAQKEKIMNISKKILALVVALVMMAALLCACDGGTPAESTPSTNSEPSTPSVNIPTEDTKPKDDGKVTYTVTVVDQNNNPVEGVAIQFCDDENCKLPVLTDASGVVSQRYAESEYHITLAELPAGYTSEETEFYFNGETELTIVITAE